MTSLTKQVWLARDLVKDPVSFKYMQIKLYIDLLDKLIDQSKESVLKASLISAKPQAQLNKLASLKVAKKKLEEELHMRARLRGFTNDREVLTYSWRLF